MRLFAPIAVTAAVVLALSSPAHAQPKDSAELFPAQTLAYLEVRQPEKLAKEGIALVKGSGLEDLAAICAKARMEHPPKEDFFDFGYYSLASFGMFFSPEGMGEFGRVGGGAVAITGWNKDDGPEVVGVIYPGECNLVMMYMRMYLAGDGEMRILDKVEGVNLYRARGRAYPNGINAPGGAPPAPPPIVDKGPTIALLPNMVVIASTPNAAKEVVRRAKGKSSEPSLASLSAFKRSTELRGKPGLFGYADISALAAQVDQSMKGRPPQPEWTTIKTLTNPQGLGPAVASLTVDNGNVNFRLQLQTDPKQPSPLLELLPDKKAMLDGLHFAPKDGLLSVTLALPDGAKRWEKLVALLDTVARASFPDAPEERLPSKEIAADEAKAGISLAKDVFAKVAGVTFTIDLRDAAVKKGPSILLALTASDEDAAPALADVLPKLMVLGGPVVAPEKEKVDGVTIATIPAKIMPWPLSYGRQGKTLVLGQSKETVAASLKGGSKKGGLLGEAKVATALKGTDDALVVGVASLSEILTQMMKATEAPRIVRTSTVPPGAIPPPPKEEKPSATTAKFIKELTRVAEPLPPAVMTISRKGDVYVLEMKLTALRTASAKVINVFIDRAIDEIQSGKRGGGIIESAPNQDDRPVEKKP